MRPGNALWIKQQINVARGAKRRVGIGMPSQPCAFEGDWLVARRRELAAYGVQLRLQGHGFDSGAAVSGLPRNCQFARNATIRAMQVMKERQYPVLRRYSQNRAAHVRRQGAKLVKCVVRAR